MRIDLYTKTILTLIALLLAVIAVRPMFQPRVAEAQSSLSDTQFSVGWGTSEGLTAFFDRRTGDIWTYSEAGKVEHIGKLTQLGKPMLK
jgi:hypothetical protein